LWGDGVDDVRGPFRQRGGEGKEKGVAKGNELIVLFLLKFSVGKKGGGWEKEKTPGRNAIPGFLAIMLKRCLDRGDKGWLSHLLNEGGGRGKGKKKNTSPTDHLILYDILACKEGEKGVFPRNASSLMGVEKVVVPGGKKKRRERFGWPSKSSGL